MTDGDLISRQAVDTLVDELARAISDERCFISRGRSTGTIMQDILDLPSVTPQPKEKQTDGDLISRESVITMLNKIENAVEDGEGFQFNEWIEYAKDIPSAKMKGK